MQPDHPAPNSAVELAAGALVWSAPGRDPRLAVVRRGRHADWALPKGRPEPGEDLAATAAREAAEETGTAVELAAFAGTYQYPKDGRTKHVVMWHAWRRSGPAPAGPDGEIAEVAWLSPAEALDRLTYANERELVRRHSAPPPAGSRAEG